MARPRRGWPRILVGLVLVGMVLAGCSGSDTAVVSSDVPEAATPSSVADVAATDGTAALRSAMTE